MRIVGGLWRGRPLKAPEGTSVTRPSTDRLREAIASMVQSYFGLDLSEVSVLDAFAGSGAVGLELLSRGAAYATFMESDRKALRCLKANIAALGCDPAQVSVLTGDSRRLASVPALEGAPFSAVFLDPPYAKDPELSAKVVEGLLAAGHLQDGALLVHERAADAAPLQVAGTALAKSRSHGGSVVELLRVSD